MKKHTLLQRLLPLAMLAAMLLSAVPAAAAFRDTAGHWAAETLSAWQDEGLIDGYGDGSFRPDGTMTRAEFAKLVNRTMGFTAESEISFSDVTERDWFYAEVAKAAAAGYAQGSGGAFRPNQAVTRAEAAAMLARAAGLAANEERADAFADAASIPAWAKGSVGAAAEAGYMNGYPNGAFGALDPITRAEAVVTLDRVRASRQETVIEKAGTTLENETISGDLVIAESVGEGNVTLKNVTVRGSVTVRGGGANSIYFDNVRVSGTVRLEKEGVHLRLTGGTALERVEIGLPCRITQDGTFEGALGALVIDLAKDSAKEIQIEVPAKRVELVSRASVSLGADVGELLVGKDAEDAQLEIRRGASVGDLTVDAKIRLTGDGAVISLVVSVSGVTVSGTLSVEKTETEGGAEAPTTSGSSSGGSSSGGSSGGGSYTPVRIVTGAEPVADVAVDHGTSEADAMSRLPSSVTLNVTEDGAAGTLSAAVRWALDKAYDAEPRMDTVYTATGTVTIPDGYTYDGTLTVTASLTVKADPEKVVVRISEVTGLELPYGSTEGDAQLPEKVTLTPAAQQGFDDLLADVTWVMEGDWASPGVNTFTGTVTMPDGYYYNGETTAAITTTVTVVESGETAQTKRVVDYVPLPLTSIGYARTKELVLAAARQKGLPTSVTLKCEDDSYLAVTVPADDWGFTYEDYYPNTSSDQTLSFTADAALPMGYDNHDGKMTVYCRVEVKALDTAALDGALAAAKAQLDRLTEDEAEALAGSGKIFVAGNGTMADSVTKGVKFVELSQTATLKDAYTAAWEKKTGDRFDSQTDCDRTAQGLRGAADAFAAIEPNVGTLYTNEMILEAVKGGPIDPQYSSDYAYSTQMQPLRNGYTYWLYRDSWAVPDSDVRVSIDWSFRGDGARYLALAPDGGRNHKGNLYGYGVTVTGQPDEPKEVQFIATVKDFDGNVIGTLGENGEYTATIGVPIRVDTSATVAPPRMTSAIANNISVRVPLTGGVYIIRADTERVTVQGIRNEVLSITGASLTENGSWRADSYGLFLPVTATCGAMEMKTAPVDYGSGTVDPVHEVGQIKITIPRGALTVDESSGWYAPNEDLEYTANVWCCNPAVTVMTQGASSGSNVTVQIEYAYRKFFGAVAYATENSAEGAKGATLKVRFNADDWQDGLEKDCITCTQNVSLDPNQTYYVWCNFNGNDANDPLSTGEDWINTGMMIQ
mgnify:CR=1 FL=1